MKIQKEIRLIDSLGNHHAKATIEKIFINAEQEVHVVGALIYHYRKVKRDTVEELESIEVFIESNMKYP